MIHLIGVLTLPPFHCAAPTGGTQVTPNAHPALSLPLYFSHSPTHCLCPHLSLLFLVLSFSTILSSLSFLLPSSLCMSPDFPLHSMFTFLFLYVHVPLCFCTLSLSHRFFYVPFPLCPYPHSHSMSPLSLSPSNNKIQISYFTEELPIKFITASVC